MRMKARDEASPNTNNGKAATLRTVDFSLDLPEQARGALLVEGEIAWTLLRRRTAFSDDPEPEHDGKIPIRPSDVSSGEGTGPLVESPSTSSSIQSSVL